jgi:hypothetical protein
VLEAILVGSIVLLAALYATWTLLPASLRLRMARAIADWGRRPGRSRGAAGLTAAIERAAARRVGGCSDCSAVQSAPGRPGDRRDDTP